ncbi:BnaCnng34060D [Brassica napus]|uniref:Uncharacterized protein n=2 Tax=Brassica TaxID=3705 RepID=A0A3P6ANI4_BRAOL|nr:unnamed protein product [Brassica napus]CDY59016.1 BnaCnng34060D [Brassica napus]VDC86870.1 unnamed protein product [Brassica oleracea]
MTTHRPSLIAGTFLLFFFFLLIGFCFYTLANSWSRVIDRSSACGNMYALCCFLSSSVDWIQFNISQRAINVIRTKSTSGTILRFSFDHMNHISTTINKLTAMIRIQHWHTTVSSNPAGRRFSSCLTIQHRLHLTGSHEKIYNLHGGTHQCVCWRSYKSPSERNVLKSEKEASALSGPLSFSELLELCIQQQ